MTTARGRWAGLVFISVAVALIIVDSTIVNVAIPAIVADLSVTSTQVQWVQESYTLVFAALLLVFGTLADRYGRRLLLLTGVGVFAAASVLAALAPSGELLIGSRLLQGVGGAMVLPTTLSLINATFRGKERGIAFAVWGSTIGGMVALGPLLGGWLTTYYSWRWAFGINVPLGLIIVAGVLAFVSESKDAAAPSRIDAAGAILSVIASATLVFGLIEGRTYGWWQANAGRIPKIGSWTWPFELSPIPAIFALTLLSAVAFVWWGIHRERSGKTTLLALSLFKIPSFRNGNIAAMIVSLGEFGIILSLPLWLQNVIGYDALQTGLVLLALALGSFVASGVSGVFGQRVTPVTIVRMGIVAEIIGVAGLGLVITADATWLSIVPLLFVYGIGVGLATAQLTGVVLTVGGSLDAKLAERAPLLAVEARSQIVEAVVVSAGGAIPGLVEQNSQIGNAARDAFSQGTGYSAFAAAGFLVLGFLARRLTAPWHAQLWPTREYWRHDLVPSATERHRVGAATSRHQRRRTRRPGGLAPPQ